MINTHTTLNDLFTDIADAIRAKNNTTDTIIADDFPAEISKLKSGFDYINNTVTILPDSAFINNEDINNVELGSITSIGANAFENCQNLYIAELPNTLTSIGENAFNDCPELIIFSKHSSQPNTWNVNWNPDNRPVVWGEPIKTWDISATENDNVRARLFLDGNFYTLVVDGQGAMEEYRSGDNWDSPWIEEEYYNQIKTIIVLPQVSHIGRISFAFGQNLTTVILSSSIITMGDNVFWNCTNLNEITLPKNLNSFYGDTFDGCNNLMQINVNPQNLYFKSIDGNVYSKDETIFVCNAKGQTNLTISNKVSTIKNRALSNSAQLHSIILSNNLQTIEDYAFESCPNLVEINLPDTLKTIGTGAFDNCTSLITMSIPQNVSQIGSRNIFAECTNLQNIIVDTNNEYYESIDGCLYSKNPKVLKSIPCTKTNIVIPEGTTEIGWDAARGCTKLQNFTIPNSVKTLGGYTFKNCHTLTNMTIPNGVTYLPYQLFCFCTKLTTVTIPNTVQQIYYSFVGCTSLTAINFTGTMAEWNAIKKDDLWDDRTGNYTIYCTDGNIPKTS